MSDDGTALDKIQREARIQARQFARVFKTPDGKAVLECLKQEFGWDAATPMPDKEGNISASRLRAWTGSRGVIASILHKISTGNRLDESTNEKHDNDT